MKNTNEIMLKYTAAEITLEEANAALAELGKGWRLDPNKNALTEEEKRSSTIGYYPEQANGYGLLDTGTGSMDKVHVKDGKLTTGGMGIMTAYVYICGRCYEVKDTVLVEV